MSESFLVVSIGRAGIGGREIPPGIGGPGIYKSVIDTLRSVRPTFGTGTRVFRTWRGFFASRMHQYFY